MARPMLPSGSFSVFEHEFVEGVVPPRHGTLLSSRMGLDSTPRISNINVNVGYAWLKERTRSCMEREKGLESAERAARDWTASLTRLHTALEDAGV